MALGGVYPDRRGRAGIWRAVFYDRDGRRVERRIVAPTKRAARQLWADMAAEAQRERRGLVIRGEHTTLGDYWREHYAPWMHRAELAESTVLKREQVWALHLSRRLGRVPLSRLDGSTVPPALDKMRNRKTGAPLAPSSRAYVERALTAALHHAAAAGYLGPEVARAERAGTWRKPWRSRRAAALPRWGLTSLAELAALLRHAQRIGGRRLALAIALAVTAGHRRGEQREIEWAHCTEAEGGWIVRVWKTKNRKPRAALLAGPLAELMSAHRLDLDKLGLSDTRWVFPAMRTRVRKRQGRRELLAERGGQVARHVVSDAAWDSLRAAAGLPGPESDRPFRFHDLRGSHAKLLTRLGLPERDVQRAMGHSSPEVTRIYTAEMLDDAAARAAALYAQLELDLPAEVAQ